jgi:N-acetylglucosaminyldiphosphoundecaprenol N-acetyl-beta-D-mannosaminyltransferase
MTFNLSEADLFKDTVYSLQIDKLLINTFNAYSYNIAQTDALFRQALLKSDVLIPDGISMVWAIRWLKGEKIKKIAGADMFFYEIERLQKSGGKCFFLGSTETTLKKIKDRAAREYPKVKVQYFCPPFKPAFTVEDNLAMLEAINAFQPDVLFVGMTAPKQEKWAYQHFKQIEAGHVCCIGAVFDFYAATIKRAPKWMINLGLEWLYRLIREPRRMWRRYLIGNTKFIWFVLKEKYGRKITPDFTN